MAFTTEVLVVDTAVLFVVNVVGNTAVLFIVGATVLFVVDVLFFVNTTVLFIVGLTVLLVVKIVVDGIVIVDIVVLFGFDVIGAFAIVNLTTSPSLNAGICD